METKIKNCPFCGGREKRALVLGRRCIACTKCMAVMLSAYKQERSAISKAWNSRAERWDGRKNELDGEWISAEQTAARLERWANGESCDGCPARDDLAFHAAELIRKAYGIDKGAEE